MPSKQPGGSGSSSGVVSKYHYFDTPSDFVLVMNWILLPKGLNQLFTELEKSPLPRGAQLTYDTKIGGFRVGCEVNDETEVVTRINAIIDSLILSEVDKVAVPDGARPLEESRIVRHVSEFRSTPRDKVEELEYQKFQVPRDVGVCGFSTVWRLPQDFVEDGLTIERLFGSFDPVVEISSTATGCIVRKALRGESLYLGAKTQGGLEMAQRRLNTLLKYYEMASNLSGTEMNVVLSERTSMVEFRHVRAAGHRLSSTLLIDLPRAQRTAYKETYKTLFSDGILLRGLVSNGPGAWKPRSSLRDGPAVSEARIDQEFAGIRELKRVSKEILNSSLLIPLIPVQHPIGGQIKSLPQACSDLAEPNRLVAQSDNPPSHDAVPKAADQKPSRSSPLNTDEEDVGKASRYLADALEVYRMFSGHVSLKAEIGRFVLYNIHPKYVSDTKHSGLIQPMVASVVADKLDKHHEERQPNALTFTKMVTTKGGDANYIASLENPGSAPSTAHLQYEFKCVTATTAGSKQYFTVVVNGRDLSFSLKKTFGETTKVFAHCPNRVFDFQLRVDAVQDLQNYRSAFASELVASLQIRPTADRMAQLVFMISPNWRTVVKDVRVYKLATYKRQSSIILNIRQVQATRLVKDELGNHTVTPAENDPEIGHHHKWFEVYLESAVLQTWFIENQSLRFAEEASWSVASPGGTTPVVDLVLAAAKLVKKMDGVGYWGAKHGERSTPAQGTSPDKSKAKVKDVEMEYW